MAKKTLFTAGCDPEFFLKNREGKWIAGIEYITGTKILPQDIGKGCGAMQDNVAIEFCMPAAMSESNWIKNLRNAITGLRELIPADLSITAEASAEFTMDQLMHPVAQEAGCDPDFCAWKDGARNPRPALESKSLRSAGGHVHIGAPCLKTKKGKIMAVKLCDATLGLMSVVLDQSPSSAKRRQLYGKAGCFRPTEYGIEYRTLSNFWMKSPIYSILVYRFSAEVIRIIKSNQGQALLKKILADYSLEALINNGNVEGALECLAEYIMPRMGKDTVELFVQAAAKADRELVLEKEWGLSPTAVTA